MEIWAFSKEHFRHRKQIRFLRKTRRWSRKLTLIIFLNIIFFNFFQFDPLVADGNRRWKTANVRIGLESRVMNPNNFSIWNISIKYSFQTIPKDKKALLDQNTTHLWNMKSLLLLNIPLGLEDKHKENHRWLITLVQGKELDLAVICVCKYHWRAMLARTRFGLWLKQKDWDYLIQLGIKIRHMIWNRDFSFLLFVF